MDSYELWLDREPSAQDIIASIPDASRYREVVFCGFGEPLCAVDTVVEVARDLKKRFPGVPLRINTNGQANLIHGRNVLPELAWLIDVVSISLNAETADKYVELCRPKHGKAAYQAMLDFARESKKYIPKVVLSVVARPGVDIEACRRIAQDLAVEFRVREEI
jgi:TatD family-associated radical SAM protein